jgi:predicted phage terminase large subunit-like protein
LEFVLERKKLETQASWESLFQQNPIIVGGGRLPIDKLTVLPVWDRSKIIHSVRYWDKASSTSGDAAFTAGVLMHKLVDGRFVIEDIVRGRWNALDRESKIFQTAYADRSICKTYEVVVEQEPGSGGKESAENTVRSLAGFRASADRVTGSKEIRAEPFEAQVQAGNAYLIAGAWVRDFKDECESWPHGRYKDQVDAAAGAFNKLSPDTTYIQDYKLWAY